MINVGEIVRVNREVREISQEDLCHGICSVSNLSRIENGEQVPGRAKFEALMQRMGLSGDVYPSFLNKQEEDAFRLRHEINRAFTAERYTEAEALLAKLEALASTERVYRQFVLFCRALLLRCKGGDPAEVLAAMQQVVEMSIRDFAPKKILRHVLTKDEMSIIKFLAASYYDVGEVDYAIEILYALKDYIERKVVDNDMITPTYTAVLHTLTNYVGKKGLHEAVLRLCEDGIRRCVEYSSYYAFAQLLFNKGYALVMLDRKEEARKYLQEAFYLNRAVGRLKSCEINKAFADKHGIDL